MTPWGNLAEKQKGVSAVVEKPFPRLAKGSSRPASTYDFMITDVAGGSEVIFDNAIAATGHLSMNFSSINPNTTFGILDVPAAGFKDFTAFQVADMTPDHVPEPATGLLVALGLVALAARRRLR